jgi:hypothetical protein
MDGMDRRSGMDRRINTLTPADRRWFLGATLPPLLIASVAIITVLLVFVREPLPAIDYGAVVVPISPPEVCPGESFRVQVETEVHASDTLVIFAQSWINLDVNERVGVEPMQVVPFPASTLNVANFVITVPRVTLTGGEMLPGNYEYRRGAQSLQSEGSIVRVPFMIRAGCGDGTPPS